MFKRLCGLFLMLLAGGCATVPDVHERAATAATLAAAQGWQAVDINAPPFLLLAYRPAHASHSRILTIYIEGDGLAWLSGATPSADPTPRSPVALQLALAHHRRLPVSSVAWLGRPCQYVHAERTGCAQRYWTDARFALDVVAALDSAVTELKRAAKADTLVLAGYSGGGALAVLLAARRNDVSGLVTVAGNLDHAAWTQHHGVRPLRVSLNPADVADKVAAIPQRHFVGSQDVVIPPGLVRYWPVALQGPRQANLTIVSGQTHACCWANHWPGLLESVMPEIRMAD